jgi:hypothetical protein
LLTVLDIKGLNPIAFVDTNYLGQLLHAERTANAESWVMQHATSTTDKLKISPKVYDEFVGQDPDPQTQKEKRRLMKKYGISRDDKLCGAVQKNKYKAEQKRLNAAMGERNRDDANIAAYASTKGKPFISQNYRDFIRGDPKSVTELGGGFYKFVF